MGEGINGRDEEYERILKIGFMDDEIRWIQ
jgi:hypothetical protein